MAVPQGQQFRQVMMDICMVDIGKTLMNEMFKFTTTLIVMNVQGQVGVMVSMGADGQWEQAAP